MGGRFHQYRLDPEPASRSSMENAIRIYIYLLRIPPRCSVEINVFELVMCSVSTNGERASLANLKLTIGSLLECS